MLSPGCSFETAIKRTKAIVMNRSRLQLRENNASNRWDLSDEAFSRTFPPRTDKTEDAHQIDHREKVPTGDGIQPATFELECLEIINNVFFTRFQVVRALQGSGPRSDYLPFIRVWRTLSLIKTSVVCVWYSCVSSSSWNVCSSLPFMLSPHCFLRIQQSNLRCIPERNQ